MPSAVMATSEPRSPATSCMKSDHDRSAPDASAVELGDALRRLTVPTLVLHGEDDPLLPVECGRDVAALVPGAKIETFPGWGHDVPEQMVPRLIGSISGFCKAA